MRGSTVIPLLCDLTSVIAHPAGIPVDGLWPMFQHIIIVGVPLKKVFTKSQLNPSKPIPLVTIVAHNP